MTGTKWPPTNFRLLSPQSFNWTQDDIFLYNQIIDYVNTINSFIKGKIELEQYTLPAQLIAFILVYVKKDLRDQRIVEFGSGTGRFSLPILKFFSPHLLCVDVDSEAMFNLRKLLKARNLSAKLVIAAIEFLETYSWKDSFEVTIMNPPFGTKRRGIDIVFLEKALNFSNKVISVHKSNQKSRKLINRIGRSYNKSCEILATLEFPIPPIFTFHRKRNHKVFLDIYRFEAL